METQCIADPAEVKMGPHWQGGYTFSGAVGKSRIKNGDATVVSKGLQIAKQFKFECL